MKQFFTDDSGNLSAMRLYCFIALIVAVVLSFNGGPFNMVILWITAAFTPKAIQKAIEIIPIKK